MKNGNGGHGLVREERLQIMLAPEELKAVDTFRFAHRMPSRAAAVRELLRAPFRPVGGRPWLEDGGVTVSAPTTEGTSIVPAGYKAHLLPIDSQAWSSATAYGQ